MPRGDRHARLRRALGTFAVSLLGAALPVLPGHRAALLHHQLRLPPTTIVHVDGHLLGPAFQGIGAISGGGGNSRYLIDYPPAERRAILDLLFTPRRGASLQMLKLEIGGNANSSDGAEPSVEQRPGHLTCDVGYEFWLAHQALRRNPAVKLYGLQWSAPGWVRGRGDTLWTRADVGYVLDWLGCARRAGLRISYLGGWNEHYTPGSPVIAAWYVALRRALDQHGYRAVQIVAADAYGSARHSAYAVAADMAANPALARAIGVIGVHDVCGVESDGESCQSSPLAHRFARRAHVLIWQSELGRTPSVGTSLREDGPPGLARTLNSEYIDAGITGTLLWPLVDAMPPGLPFSDRGLITADQPWSGAYRVSRLTWVVAQTTQFVAPGWHFLRGADGTLARGGTYVTYAPANRRAWSMVVQTSTARSAQDLRIHVGGGLPGLAHVWATPLLHGPALVEVARRVRAVRGWLNVELGPGSVYTITTTTGQGRGVTARTPRPVSMPLPYTLRPDAAGMAGLLAPMEGSFQYVRRTLTQTTVGAPVPWMGCERTFPYAVVGSSAWHELAVSATVTLPHGSARGPRPGAFVLAGFSGFKEPCEFSGYDLGVDSAGGWRLVHSGDEPALLAAGRVRPSRRYRLELLATGRRLVAVIDGVRVDIARVPAPVRGLAGLGAFAFDAVRYDRFAVRRA